MTWSAWESVKLNLGPERENVLSYNWRQEHFPTLLEGECPSIHSSSSPLPSTPEPVSSLLVVPKAEILNTPQSLFLSQEAVRESITCFVLNT